MATGEDDEQDDLAARRQLGNFAAEAREDGAAILCEGIFAITTAELSEADLEWFLFLPVEELRAFGRYLGCALVTKIRSDRGQLG